MLKIGLLTCDLLKLENWELRIIDALQKDPNLDLVLLIQNNVEFKKNKCKELNYGLGKFIFKSQLAVEKMLYKKDINIINKKPIFDYIISIPTIKLSQKNNRDTDIFSKDIVDKIKNYEIDLFINFAFDEVNGEILTATKQGIWELCHGESSEKVKGPAGFFEVLRKKSSIKTSLTELSKRNPNKIEIDRSFCNPDRHWSHYKTNNLILESSVSLLFKNIRKLIRSEQFIGSSVDYKCDKCQSPDVNTSIQYIINFYTIVINKIIQKVNMQFGKRYDCWTLFIGEGNFLESDLKNLAPVQLPEGEFWADPFLFEYENDLYVFFENYSYRSKRGKISCGKIVNKQIVEVVDVLNLDYHLSYPFIFKDNGHIYLMPESSENRRLEIYKCKKFPVDWELYTTAFEGETVVDPFFYEDDLNQKWLFVNKMPYRNIGFDNELHIYKVNSIKLDSIVPHKDNPVIIDNSRARNGGNIFHFKNNVFRPSQSSTDGIYGKSLKINVIEKLSLDEYIEKTIKLVEPSFTNGLVSMHHVHQSKRNFIIDAAYKKI